MHPFLKFGPSNPLKIMCANNLCLFWLQLRNIEFKFLKCGFYLCHLLNDFPHRFMI